ncbi:sulfatase-like hydrolase/transferase [Caldalkalibacillus salinus]|uniref:sulfatase-like hydrolase/transferase n=1 Tax=Caldalkalibacillus salinus TaxID=2803787 RepID=UPI0019238F63
MQIWKNTVNKIIESKSKILYITFWAIILFKIFHVEYLMRETVSILSFGITLGIIFLLSSLTYVLTKRRVYTYFIIINALITILLIGDLLYFRYFGTPLTTYLLLQSGNLSGLGPSIVSLLNGTDLLLFMDIFVVLALLIFNSNTLPDTNRNYKKLIKYAVIGIILVSIVPTLILTIGHGHVFQRYHGMSFVKTYGVLGHHVADAMSFTIESKRVNLSDHDKEKIRQWFLAKEGKFGDRDNNHEYFSLAENKNLILIQVESLQNFTLNLEVEGHEITPHLNSVLDHSLYFSNIYPQTREGNSSDAELLVNTSSYPIGTGATVFRYPDTSYMTLGQQLKEKGYASNFALHGDDGDFWNRTNVYPYLAFDQYYHLDYFDLDEEIGMGLSDRSFFRQSISLIAEKEQPFYAYFTTLTSHTPFEIPEEYKTLDFSGDISGSYLGHYLESVHYADHAIGSFLDELDNIGLLDHSIVVFYGDHKGVFPSDIPQIETYLGDDNIDNELWLRKYEQVPFIIYNPAFSGERIEVIGGHIDIMPTLLSILGIEEEQIAHGTMGIDLFSIDQEYGSAFIPSGDYNKQAYVTPDKVMDGLPKDAREALDIAELIIRGNYHKDDQE